MKDKTTSMGNEVFCYLVFFCKIPDTWYINVTGYAL